MSDLSRLRARWVRLEKRIATLEAQAADSEDDGEIMEITEKVQIAKDKLAQTIQAVGVEEKRLFDRDAMLRFTNI